MSKLFAACCAAAVSLSLAHAEEGAAPAVSITAASEARYFSWHANRGFPVGVAPADGRGSGSELYIPYALQLVGRPSEDLKVEVLGRAGWVWARQATAGLSGEVATTTDTVLSSTFTYLGLSGIQPFVSLNFNLPTGRSALFGTAANARMDPDLVDISTFGEGLNVGPTVGLNLPISSTLLLTASAGYTWRGSYLRESPLAPTLQTLPTAQAPTYVDPGDVLTFYAAVGYQNGPVAAKVTGSVSHENPTLQNDVDFYRTGLRVLATGTFSYTWPEYGVTTLDLSASHTSPNEVVFLASPAELLPEPLNTNSNLYRIGIQHLVPLDRLTIGPTASFLYRDHNGYDSTTLQFVPAKTRYAIGAIARYGVTDNLVLNARIEGLWTREDDRPAPGNVLFSVLANSLVPATPVPTVSSTGVQIAVGANLKM